jgi:hypothetical protein
VSLNISLYYPRGSRNQQFGKWLTVGLTVGTTFECFIVAFSDFLQY